MRPMHSALKGALRGTLAAMLLVLAGQMGAGQAGAQGAPVVVELYTSQGCSACPPADTFMAELAGREDVIALALHVDYWDYIGWADPFAQPQFTERQKAYARAVGSKTIYTPQMIVGGADRVEGFRAMEVVDLIRRHAGAGERVALGLDRAGDRLRISLGAEPPLPGHALVQLVRYRPQETVSIERGENAGRTVTYHNIVTHWEHLADWPGDRPLEIEAVVPGPEPVVVIVQQPGPGPVLAAAALR